MIVRAMELYRRLKAAAQRRGLRFVLVGGHAVNLHGYARSTTDLDILVCKDDREVWLSAAAELGDALSRDGLTFLQLRAPAPSEWPLDLMLVGRETFEGVAQAAQPMRLFDDEVPVVSLSHLLALKLHALKHTNVGPVLKDYEDILNLATINKLDLRSDEFRDLCLRYGTIELYERILRLSQA